jgi:hypothetical protein
MEAACFSETLVSTSPCCDATQKTSDMKIFVHEMCQHIHRYLFL